MIFPMPNLSEKRIERTSFRNVLWPFSRKSARRPLSVLRLNLLDAKIVTAPLREARLAVKKRVLSFSSPSEERSDPRRDTPNARTGA